MKQRIIIFLSAVLIFSQVCFVLAQTPPGLDQETIQNDNVVKGVQQLQNFTDKDRLDYLSKEWQELLLQNRYISAADSFFKNLNWAFLFLFGRNYELSLALFFAVLMWLATFSMLPRFFVFLREMWMRYLAAFGGTVILAQLQLFNAVSNLLIRVYFYKFEWWWKVISLAVIFAGIGAYTIFLRYFGKIIEANKKKKAEEQATRDRQALNTVVNELRDASQSNP